MIDISGKFHVQTNSVIHAYYINVVWGHNQTPKVASNMQRIAYSSSFIPCKNQRKLLTRGVIFTVNTYECFMEKKEHSTVVNLKKNIEPNQTFTGSYKKCEALGELQDTHNIKSKKANKFW